MDKIEREGEPAIYHVDDDDAGMNEAIHKARTSLGRFDEALHSGDTSLYGFSLKEKFETPDGSEHIWIVDVSKQGDNYLGYLGNKPNKIPSLAEGDSVTVPLDKISDWMFLDRGRLRGGYTLRLLRSRMSDQEKKAFDSSFGVVIDGKE